MILSNLFQDKADVESSDRLSHFEDDAPQSAREKNVGVNERRVSVAAGAVLTVLGLERRGILGLAVAGIGAGLLYRGATGHCPAYSAMKINTATNDPDALAERGTHVAESFLIDRSPQELYDTWRNFENLPRIMSHLQSVSVIDSRRSKWVAKAPKLVGGKAEWEAEITRDEPGQRIDWRSVPGSQVDNAGSVRFVQAAGDRGTKVTVELDYLVPAGQVGRWVSKIFGEAPERQIREDLRNFKRIVETGEIATIQGQPRGTCTGQGKRTFE
jgi:uncharacterized membrane protein